jgi:hypothetical protein
MPGVTDFDKLSSYIEVNAVSTGIQNGAFNEVEVFPFRPCTIKDYENQNYQLSDNEKQ